MSSMTHKYIPMVTEQEENIFLEEYYSGTDVKVFINDEEQKEISYIQYSVNEQLKPIYGYNSRVFDDVAVGNRIVIGVFKIPIKNPSPQSSRETVISEDVTPDTMDIIENRNKSQLDLTRSKEWTNNIETKQSSITNDEILEYQIKLKDLGYKLNCTGVYDTPTVNAIRLLQVNNSLSLTNTLTTETMASIDKQLDSKKLKRLTLAANAVLYSGPSFNSLSLGTIQAGDSVALLSEIFTGFLMVRTDNGEDGYIIKETSGG